MSRELILALGRAGADLIEVGVPFSHSIAVAPVNQRASGRALAAGASLSGVLRMVAATRGALGVPVVLRTDYNPIHRRGVAAFAEQAASSGVDAVLCVDLPPEVGARELEPALADRGVGLAYFLASTTPRRRQRMIAGASRGFLCYGSATGDTDTSIELSAQRLREIRKLRRRVELPLAVDFDTSTPEEVAKVGAVADGVVIGSALVRLVESRAGDSRLVAHIEERAALLRQALGREAG
jgi:tryptophan synthase alpha chain